MKLVKKNIFAIPLYHGTSSLFLDSIIKNGLGGNDPLNELGARELFYDLYELANKKLVRDESWQRNHHLLSPYVKQQNLGGNFSFKHGESYLAIGRELAIKYAHENVYGSEYLTQMMWLHTLLTLKKVEGLEAFETRSIMKLLRGSYDPILITLNDVNVEDVETETGRPLQEQLEEIEMFLKKGMIAPLSFKLICPIYKENFTITKLHRDSDCKG